MNKKLYIVGAGGVGAHLALNLREYSEEYKVEGFFDDDPEKIGTELYGRRVLGPVEEALDLEQSAVAIGIAFPRIKRSIVDKLATNRSISYPSFVHDRAWISKGVTLGRGSIVYPGTTINYGSEILDFVVLNVNCSLGHHTAVGRFSSFAPGVNTGGHTVIEEAVEMGIGASTLQDVRIGSGSIVGGMSMVIREVEPGTTVSGVPAKVLS